MTYIWNGTIDEVKFEKYQDVFLEDLILTRGDNYEYLIDIEE
jgi:hypothetical protein